jgi:hypothetical protein
VVEQVTSENLHPSGTKKTTARVILNHKRICSLRDCILTASLPTLQKYTNCPGIFLS